MAYLDDLQVSINNITTSSQNIEFVILATQITTATNSRCLSVPDVNSLPVLTTSTNYPEGQIIFVESVGVPVISAQNKWIGLDGRTLRKDFISRELWSWGRNCNGISGHGNTINKKYPTREISRSVNWNTISGGGTPFHSVGIKNNGELWSWGCNCCGQLGIGNVISSGRCSPVREFCSATDWCQVSAGGLSTLAIKTSGQLWAWGSNVNGVLGIGSSVTLGRCSPVREFCSANDWCTVSISCINSSAIKTSGELWTWGSNTCGQLGIGSSITINNRCSPVREFCSATDWCQVSVSLFFMGAVKTTGQIWTWGANSFAQLGIGNSDTTSRCSPVREFCSATDWCQLSSGCYSFVALKTNGELWGWGRNNCFNLGDNTTITRCSPVREFCSATNWCKVSAGSFHVAAIKTDGKLWTWGGNVYGELGNGSLAVGQIPSIEATNDNRWCNVFGGFRMTSALKIT